MKCTWWIPSATKVLALLSKYSLCYIVWTGHIALYSSIVCGGVAILSTSKANELVVHLMYVCALCLYTVCVCVGVCVGIDSCMCMQMYNLFVCVHNMHVYIHVSSHHSECYQV